MSQCIPEVCGAIMETMKEYIMVSSKENYFSRLKVRTLKKSPLCVFKKLTIYNLILQYEVTKIV